MTSGKYEVEYLWALDHPDDPDGRALLNLAQLYAAHADEGALGLIAGTAADIRRKIEKGIAK